MPQAYDQKSQLEIIARLRFMADEDRDPTSCSLIFFALGKKKVLHGLWRQAPGHKEQAMMLKFLSNDFELERWKSAAVKNAYALLSKQRYGEFCRRFHFLRPPLAGTRILLSSPPSWLHITLLASSRVSCSHCEADVRICRCFLHASQSAQGRHHGLFTSAG